MGLFSRLHFIIMRFGGRNRNSVRSRHFSRNFFEQKMSTRVAAPTSCGGLSSITLWFSTDGGGASLAPLWCHRNSSREITTTLHWCMYGNNTRRNIILYFFCQVRFFRVLHWVSTILEKKLKNKRKITEFTKSGQI